MTYRILAWDHKRHLFLQEFWLPNDKECFLGRHADNHCVIDHPDLAQFHLQLKTSPQGLCITPIPGATAPKIRLTPREIFQRLDPRAPKNCKAGPLNFKKGGGFCLGAVAIEILQPHSLSRRKWPSQHALPDMASKAQTPPKPKPHQPFKRLRLLFLSLFTIGVTGSFLHHAPPTPPRKTRHPVENPLPVPVATPVSIAADLKIHEAKKPVVTPPQNSKTPLGLAKQLFLRGEEQAAIALLIKTFDENPFEMLGQRAGQIAKDFEQIRQRRQTLLALQNANRESWMQLVEQEQSLLGEVSPKTKEVATQKIGQHIQTLMDEQNYSECLKYMDIANRLFPNSSKLSGLRKTIKAAAEKNFKRAYILAQIDPAKAKILYEEILRMVDTKDPLHAKVLEQLGKKR